jgi:predicted nucleic acid-binding protein
LPTTAVGQAADASFDQQAFVDATRFALTRKLVSRESPAFDDDFVAAGSSSGAA